MEGGLSCLFLGTLETHTGNAPTPTPHPPRQPTSAILSRMPTLCFTMPAFTSMSPGLQKEGGNGSSSRMGVGKLTPSHYLR